MSDYRDTVIERQLSHRTTRKRSGKTEWETYLLERAIEFWHRSLPMIPCTVWQEIPGNGGE